MDTILTYLEKHKHQSFQELPFNKLDVLLFAEFQMLKFTGVVPEDGTISLEEAFKKYEKIYDIESSVNPMMDNTPKYALRDMALSERFKDVILSNYVYINDEENIKNFSAITVDVSDDLCLLIFAPTDEMNNSWIENFHISLGTIPSDFDGEKYVRKQLENKNKDIYLVGHSKGAHVAVYSCIHVDDEKIKKCYAFDGPGFSDEEIYDEKYKANWEKVELYTPTQSIIGRLFQMKCKTFITKCACPILDQHNVFNWLINDIDFVYRDRYQDASNYLKQKVENLIEYAGPQKGDVIDSIQKLLYANGCKTLFDIDNGKSGLKTNYNSLDEETKAIVKKYIIDFFMKDWRFKIVAFAVIFKIKNPRIIGFKK